MGRRDRAVQGNGVIIFPSGAVEKPLLPTIPVRRPGGRPLRLQPVIGFLQLPQLQRRALDLGAQPGAFLAGVRTLYAQPVDELAAVRQFPNQPFGFPLGRIAHPAGREHQVVRSALEDVRLAADLGAQRAVLLQMHRRQARELRRMGLRKRPISSWCAACTRSSSVACRCACC